MAIAQKEPSLIQKDLLAQKLVEPNSCLLEAEELYYTARPRLDRSELGPRLDKPIRPDFEPRPYRTDCEPRLWLHEVAKLGLLQAEDTEAGHLLDVIRIQAVTRQEARKAAQGEHPLGQTVNGLLAIICEL